MTLCYSHSYESRTVLLLTVHLQEMELPDIKIKLHSRKRIRCGSGQKMSEQCNFENGSSITQKETVNGGYIWKQQKHFTGNLCGSHTKEGRRVFTDGSFIDNEDIFP